MKLGAFSISLSVKNLATSRAFYEKLGFRSMGGNEEHKYLIMKNGNAIIGLFEGMFSGNILTFNPGWDESANQVEDFDDVREIQQRLRDSGVKLEKEAEMQGSGPAHITLTDPDGNAILIDQHV